MIKNIDSSVLFINTEIISQNIFCDKRTKYSISSDKFRIYIHKKILSALNKSLSQYNIRSDFRQKITHAYIFILYLCRFNKSVQLSHHILAQVLSVKPDNVCKYIKFLEDNSFIQVVHTSNRCYNKQTKSIYFLRDQNKYSVDFNSIYSEYTTEDFLIQDNLQERQISRYYSEYTFNINRSLYDQIKSLLNINLDLLNNPPIYIRPTLRYNLFSQNIESQCDVMSGISENDTISHKKYIAYDKTEFDDFLEMFMYNYKFIEHYNFVERKPAHQTGERIYHGFHQLSKDVRPLCKFDDEYLCEYFDVHACFYLLLLIPMTKELQNKKITQEDFDRYEHLVKYDDIYSDCGRYLSEKYNQDFFKDNRDFVKEQLQRYRNTAITKNGTFSDRYLKMIDEYFIDNFPTVREFIVNFGITTEYKEICVTPKNRKSYTKKIKVRSKKNFQNFMTYYETKVLTETIAEFIYSQFNIYVFTLHDAVFAKCSDIDTLIENNYSIRQHLCSVLDWNNF